MESILIVCAFFLCALAVLYCFKRLPAAYFPTVFFIFKFVGARFLDFERVRYSMMFQLGIIGVLVLVSLLKWGVPKGRGTQFSLAFSRIAIFFFVLVGLSICWGLACGNETIQVFIDSYKFLEIPVLYLLFRTSWRCGDDVRRGLRSLCYIMVCCGLAEIFLTSRGGIGLNLIISIVPIVLMVELPETGRHASLFGLLIACFAVVAMCKTRTYIIAFIVAIVFLVMLLNPKARFRLVVVIFALMFIGISADLASGGSLFNQTLQRFSELSGGFQEAGGYRLAEIEYASSIISGHFVLGVGLGFLQNAYIVGMGLIEWGSFIHNAYAEILLKTGVLGLTGFLALAVAFLCAVRTGGLRVKSDDDFAYRVCMGSLISSVSWLLIYFFAPLTTFGSVFVGPIIAAVLLRVSEGNGELCGGGGQHRL